MKIETALTRELERIRDEAEQGFASDAAARRVHIRKLAHIARTWHTRLYRFAGNDVPCFKVPVEHQRAFRRAYVEAMLEMPIRCIEHPDGSIEQVFLAWDAGMKANPRLDARGRLMGNWPDMMFPMVSLSPRSIAGIVDNVYQVRHRKLRARYATLTGEELPQPLKVFEMTQWRTLRKMAFGAVMKFSARLDPVALKIARRLVLNEPGLIVRLAHQDDRIALRWQQALTAYPALVLDAWQNRNSTVLEEAIDGGKPLVPILAELHRTTEAVIRRYQGVLPQTLHRSLAGRREYVSRLAMIAELPQHLRPRRQKEHMLALRLIDDAAITRPGQLTALTRGMKVPLDREVRIAELAGFRDVKASLHRAIDPSHFGGEMDTPLDGLSLGAKIRLNREWHRAIREASIEASLADTGNVREWPGLLKGPVDLGDLMAIELTRSNDLVAEGIVMGHCVGGYTWNCMHGISRIVSLRTHDGEPVATLEIARNDRGGFVLRQNYTFHNRPAPANAVAAAKKLMGMLRRESVANKGPWLRMECETNDRQPMVDTVNNALMDFWLARYPHVVPSKEERARRVAELEARRLVRAERVAADVDFYGEDDIAF